MEGRYVLSQVASGRVPIYLVVEPETGGQRGPSEGWKLHQLLMDLDRSTAKNHELLSTLCRGVSTDRLQNVLEHGCDVYPTDAPLFVSDIVKAAEYGGDEMVLQFFAPRVLARTYCEVSSSAPIEELNGLRKTHQTELPSKDGEKIWFSKLTPHRAASPYEVEYARFIPGDPWAALRMIWLVGRNRESLLSKLEMAVSTAGQFTLVK